MSDNYDNKKKDRSQQPEQDQKDPNNKKTYSFKINLNFIYLLIGMLLLGLMFFNDDSSSQREITYGEFQQYVRNGYVNRVVGYDDNTVEAYIKQQYVQQVFKQDSGKVGKRPFVMTEAPSRHSLGEFIDSEMQQSHFDGTIQYKKRQNYFWAIFWQIMPLIFFIAFMIYLSRRMSGGMGGGIGGGIFNVGKSKAQLFEKDGKEKVTFKDAMDLMQYNTEYRHHFP